MARPANAMAAISRDSPVGVALRDALAVPALAGARVVAGAAGVDRVVQSANVMEVPDILPWVKPHELLFTTGYPLRESPDAWVGLVAALDDRGLAGLGVKLHRYVDALSEAMLAEAERRAFPVVELPRETGFADVLTQVLTRVLDHHAAALERSEEVHRGLLTVVFEG